MTGLIGGGILACGAVAAFTVADVPAGAIVTILAFGVLGLTALVRGVTAWVLRHWRSMPVPPVWAAPFTGVNAIAYAGVAEGMASIGERAAAVAFASGAAGLAGACALALSVRRPRLPSPRYWTPRAAALRAEARAGRPQWTTGERAALDARLSLEQLLGALPEARREGPFR